MASIEQYYNQKITINTNFEPFKAIPYIIEMLGRDYKDDTKSVWIASGIFFGIILKYHQRSYEYLTNDVINDILKYYKYNCIEYCLKGLAYRSFFEVFPEFIDQSIIMPLFVTLAGKKTAASLAFYLIGSEMNSQQLVLALSILHRYQYDFASDTFTKVGFELAHELLTSVDNLKEKTEALRRFFSFVKRFFLIPKSVILILEQVLNKFE